MKRYYVHTKAQENGDHEVHYEDCIFLPNPNNRKYLGMFYSCESAVKEAKKDYAKANGCKTCSKECHTT
ncbi:hypothetical protein QX233_06810 [Chryseobacterium gambrini]|uniref:Uncharacterized protein n=1 Tax=Chryseobacterium gambrini TaxID=373672 RepID=A0AAJ1R333_9FLAO|nr:MULTISPECIES: hypothetical protein [Chryseobacterium]MDN4012160.1 hypothetical protein [Chryseobacterium gambrini]MDN4029680.1 hypothetical protein [Chryseobacterium gambrini]QWA37104.1 hypothetical protein KKI44_14310 [Chryseobacterium sp. ZHDP1]